MIQPNRFSLSKLSPVFLCCFVAFCAVLLLLAPAEAGAGVSSGLMLCLQTLIPSTFPFVVLSAFCVYSGVSHYLERFLSPITRVLFHLPGCCGSVLLLGWIGGYPTGTRGVATLVKKGSITREQGERMMWFCTNSGPAFTISVIGMGLYGNVSVGVLLFCCQTLSLLLIGIGVGLWDRIRRRNLFVPSTGPEEIHPFSDALVLAANDGARGAANLCSFVMLFHALLSVMTTFGITQFLSNLLQKIGFSVPIAASLFPQLWEITSGVQSGVQLYAPLSLIVVTTAMGGLCVWCQIFAAVSSLSISKVKFVLSRFLHGLLSLVLFSIGRQWIAVSALSSSDALQASAPITEQFSQAGSTPVTSAICGAVLLVLCIVFLWCAKGKHRKSFP